MNGNRDILQSLSSLLTSGGVIKDGSFWMVEFKDDSEFLSAEEVFKNLDFKIADKDKKGKKVWFNPSSDIWVVLSLDELFNRVNHSYIVPDFFYVSSLRQDSSNLSKQKLALKVYVKARLFLAKLADHCEPRTGVSRGSDSLLLIIESEDKISKHDFRPITNWGFLENKKFSSDDLESLDSLYRILDLDDDPRESERKYVLKATLRDFVIDKCSSNEKVFETFLSSLKEFYAAYRQAHEIYVNNFSVSKVLREISEKDLEYTGKINDTVSNAQTKALTLPGVMVVVGATLKIDSIGDVIMIALGLTFITVILFKSISIIEATLTHIKKQVKTDFERYSTLSNELDVRKSAEQTKEELITLIKKASDNASFMKDVSKVVLLITIVYLLFIAFS